MNETIKFIEVNYYYHQEFMTPEEVIRKHAPSNLFAPLLTTKADIILVKHINFSGRAGSGAIRYQFFRSRNRFFHIPSATHRFIRDEKPDMVLVPGLIFPLQVIALRRKLGKHCKIVLQHQGELPFVRKRIFQKIADRFVDGYIFTATGNAEEWFNTGIIKDRTRCYELPDASTTFSRQDKRVSRQKTGMTGRVNFLWVGRLNENKDPLTVLSAFEKYFLDHPDARFYMIYSEDDLLELIKDRVQKSISLQDRVILVGKMAYEQLQDWYSGADYFVSGSHREGGGFAPREAMVCGCVPILTAIPPFLKTIDNGKAGYYYPAGDSDSLFQLLSGLDDKKHAQMSLAAEEHFRDNLSPAAIAGKLFKIYEELREK